MYQTNHHKEILTLFQQNPEYPFTAKALILAFKNSINKATIYRNLKSLEEHKLIRKSYNPNKKCYEYQCSVDCENHLHLVCKTCGKITHLTCTTSSNFIQHILKEHMFLIDQGNTILFGLCKECAPHA